MKKILIVGIALVLMFACVLAGYTIGRNERFSGLIAWCSDEWEFVRTDDGIDAYILDERAGSDGTIWLDDGQNKYVIPLYIW